MILPLLAAAWLAAFGVVGALSGPWWLVGAWFAALMPVGALRGGRRGAALFGLTATVALVGGWRFAEWQDRPLPGLLAFTGQEIAADGVIDSEPAPGRTTARFRLRVERVSTGGGAWQTTDGKLMLTLNQYAAYLPGDRVRVLGTIDAPASVEGFDFAGYLLQRGITGTMFFPAVERLEGSESSAGRVAAQVRSRLERSLQWSLPEPESSLGAGLAFGRDASLPPGLVDDLRETGLAHIVAVSGSNVAVVAAIAFWLGTRVMRRTQAVWPAAFAVAAYVLTAGPSASVTRAGLMAFVYLVGLAAGRPQAGLAALGAAAIGMTALQPATAVDVGFQLSLSATAGLFAFTPWLRWALAAGAEKARLARAIPAGLIEVFALSLAASVATMPVVWMTFGRVSLVSPLVNAVAAPVVAIAFPAALATALAGALWPPLGWLIGLAAYYPLALIAWLAEAGARVPYASVATPEAGDQATAVAIVCMALIGWLGYVRMAPDRKRPREGVSRTGRTVLIAAGGALALVVVRTSLLPLGGPGELTVTFLDVGQGDAILITTPGGRRTLIDGGPSGIEVKRELSSQLPHWSRRIDRIVLTHPQEDHVGGLPAILRRYDVHIVQTNRSTNRTATVRLFEAEAPERQTLARGDRWEESGVRFEVLWPPAERAGAGDLNNGGVVLLVTYGETSFLLAADVEREAQQAMMAASDIRADVLKVSHHGSKTSDPGFPRAVGSSIAVIMVGQGNRFGHPAPETLAALAGQEVFQTDRDGRVTIRSDGTRLRVTTER